MSIQNERVKKTTNDLLKKNLQEGILPDSKEFTWQLNQAMRNMRYNKQSVQFQPYKNTEIISSERLNRTNEAVYNDLFVLYQNLTNVYQLLNKQYKHFTIERDRVEKQIDVLENELIEFVRNSNRPGILPYAYDTFDTTTKTDLENTHQVFVDTQANEVRLVEEKNTSRKVVPQLTSRFSFQPNGIDKKEETLNGELANIFSESLDENWQKRYLLKENIEVSGELHLSFEKPEAMNQIHLSFYTVKDFLLKVTYTPDGTNWYSLPYHEGQLTAKKKETLSFPTVEVKELKITLTKEEYDETFPQEEGYNYQYLFGFQEIAFYQKNYPTQGAFYSQKLTLENKPENYLIDTVQLSVDESVPTGTSIRYEVALPGDTLDWQPIDPIERQHARAPKRIHFNQLSKNENTALFFPDEFSIRQSEAADLMRNGIPLYRLSSMQNNKRSFFVPNLQIVEGTTRLYVGRDAWEVTSYPTTDFGRLPDVADFNQVVDGTQTEYAPISEIASGDIFKNKRDAQSKKYLTRLGLYLDEATSVSAPIVTTEEVAVYLNGELLYKGKSETGEVFHYVFQSGWNELVVIINGESATDVNGMTVSLGFNPKSVTSTIYSSSQSLKEISVFDLQYNTKMNDRTVFARRQSSNGFEVLTNFGQPGLRFDLFYDYSDALDAEDGLYLRASLERDNGYNVPTPLLKKYRLDFS